MAFLLTRGAELDPYEALFLTVALRAHTLATRVQPPKAPHHIVNALADKGAALPPPESADHDGDLVPLTLHPDLLCALGTAPPPARARRRTRSRPQAKTP